MPSRKQKTGLEVRVDGDVSNSTIIIGDKNATSSSGGSRETDTRVGQHIINFDTLIAEKTNGFVGRQFVFDALDAFLSEEKSGYFVIWGEPGIGKTALMGQLVKT